MTWQTESALRHGPCGTFPWEWKDNPDAWFADHRYCEACKRRAEHLDWVMSRPSANHHAGLEIVMYSTPREYRTPGEED